MFRIILHLILEAIYQRYTALNDKLGMVLYAFPNVSDIVATTIESRSLKLADNV